MRSIRRVLPLLLCLGAAGASPASTGECPPPGQTRDSLQQLKTDGFVVAGDDARQELALQLSACLSSPEPRLRDGVAYEALATWLRASAIDLQTRRALLQSLQRMLSTQARDADGFGQPFAALVLSEVVRTDRIDPWLDDAQRVELTDIAAHYLESIRDYRGFDPVEGWRHGVAHTADLMLQLARSPGIRKPQLDRMLQAIATQVSPVSGHAYVDGESERLARAVIHIALRGMHTEADWSAWLANVAAPAPLEQWSDAYNSRRGLAQRHDVALFLFALYTMANESDAPELALLLPGLRQALRMLP